jgi:DNA-binding SARP family transcriptional activator
MQVLANLGGNYLELRRHDEARAYFRRSLADAEELGVSTALPDIHTGLARVETEAGHPDAGRDHAGIAVRLAREQELPFDHGRALRALALAESALGEADHAHRHLRESAAAFGRIQAALEAAKSEFEEGLLLARAERLPAARRRVAAALRAFDQRGLRARAEAAREAARAVCRDLVPVAPASGQTRAQSVPALQAPDTSGMTGAARAEPPAKGEPPPPIYRIECFGPLRVFRPGEAEPITPKQWGSHKARQILAYLLVGDPAGRGVLRERILTAVWPEAPPDTLGHTFHVTVSHLRKALAGGEPETLSPLVQEGGLYRLAWPGGVKVDAQEFAEAIRRAGESEAAGQAYPAEAELKRALGLARGEFLEDVHFEWAEALRVRYRQDRFQALRKLAQAAQARWDFARARELAQRLLDEEPADESAHRIVIRSLLEEDRRAEALAQYRLCARLLQRQFGLAPAPETTALIGRKVR